MGAATSAALARAGRDSIRRGLDFLETTIDESGAWHCIRFNIADPDIPRHFERPPFVSALCVLALESCEEAQAKAMCAATRTYLADTIEYPGLWRYYRHLPQDLDSTTLCSLVIGTHPWIVLGRNVPAILANRDDGGPVHHLGADGRRTRCRLALSYRGRSRRQRECHCLSRRPPRNEGCPTMAGSPDLPKATSRARPNGTPIRSRSTTQSAVPLSARSPPSIAYAQPSRNRILSLRDEDGRVRQYPQDRSGGVGSLQYRESQKHRHETPGGRVHRYAARGR